VAREPLDPRRTESQRQGGGGLIPSAVEKVLGIGECGRLERKPCLIGVRLLRPVAGLRTSHRSKAERDHECPENTLRRDRARSVESCQDAVSDSGAFRSDTPEAIAR
jgi:hypothetical protein